MMDVRSAASKVVLVSQVGSWLCQTQLCPADIVSRLNALHAYLPTSKKLSSLLRKVGDLVTLSKGEDAALGLGRALRYIFMSVVSIA